MGRITMRISFVFLLVLGLFIATPAQADFRIINDTGVQSVNQTIKVKGFTLKATQKEVINTVKNGVVRTLTIASGVITTAKGKTFQGFVSIATKGLKDAFNNRARIAVQVRQLMRDGATKVLARYNNCGWLSSLNNQRINDWPTPIVIPPLPPLNPTEPTGPIGPYIPPTDGGNNPPIGTGSVPEPSSVIMMLMGLGIGFVAYRRHLA